MANTGTGLLDAMVSAALTVSAMIALCACHCAGIACIAKRGLLLSRGREDFSDFESSVLRLKSTHVADCKPQAPPGRRWDFALELGYGRFLQIKLGPAKSLALESGPRATFGKKHGFKFL